MEIWKDIPDYEGLYQVSNLGNVKNKKTCKLKAQMTNKYGYLRVCLWKDGNYKNFTTHQLVAKTFLENKNNYSQINHKDENKLNNKVENLEWCTQKYNNSYGNRLNKIREKKEKPIAQFDLNNNLINVFNSAKTASLETGTLRSKICLCCKGKRNKTNGFRWKYYEEVI